MLVKILDIPSSPDHREKSEQALNKWLTDNGVGITIRHLVVNLHFLFIFYEKE